MINCRIRSTLCKSLCTVPAPSESTDPLGSATAEINEPSRIAMNIDREIIRLGISPNNINLMQGGQRLLQFQCFVHLSSRKSWVSGLTADVRRVFFFDGIQQQANDRVLFIPDNSVEAKCLYASIKAGAGNLLVRPDFLLGYCIIRVRALFEIEMLLANGSSMACFAGVHPLSAKDPSNPRPQAH